MNGGGTSRSPLVGRGGPPSTPPPATRCARACGVRPPKILARWRDMEDEETTPVFRDPPLILADARGPGVRQDGRQRSATTREARLRDDGVQDEIDGLLALEARLGYSFACRDILVKALTHRSFAHESPVPCADNEAMEFVGDAILAFDVSERLFRAFPHLDEGRLSKHKHVLVRSSLLATCAGEMGLATHVRLGRGEVKAGAPNERILANVFEAVIAAVFLDGGLDSARALLGRLFDPRIAALDPDNPKNDWKSLLQERTQAVGLGTPVYRILSEDGPDHQRTFRVSVSAGGRDLADGEGLTKRAAHQMAAQRALEGLRESAESDTPE